MFDYKIFAKNIVQDWKKENKRSFSFNSEGLAKLSSDLLSFLDNSIHYAENNVESTGQDKKTVVLAIMQIIFIDIVLLSHIVYII
jgi:hypothetical protein